MDTKTAAAGGLYLIRTHYYGGRTTSFEGRWAKHLRQLQRGTHPNPHMQAVFNQFGRFEPSVLLFNGGEVEEQAWLDENVGKTGCVNIAPNAAYPSRKGKTNSAEHRAKIANALRGGTHAEEARSHMAAGQQRRFAAGWDPALRAAMLETRETPEYRERQSKAHLGKRPSEETRSKIAASLRGRTLSPETRERLSQSLTGIPRSDEWRANMAKARLGKKLSEETRRKMSESQRARQERARMARGVVRE